MHGNSLFIDDAFSQPNYLDSKSFNFSLSNSLIELFAIAI